MGFQVTEVQKSLKGFDYPGSPEDLARHAQSNGADKGLVEALRNLPKDSRNLPKDSHNLPKDSHNLPKDSFDGPNAVMHSLSEADVLGGSTR
jgi:hypothetical protein